MSTVLSRKRNHLEICVNNEVETQDTLLSAIHLAHHALPELDMEEIDTSTRFLGYKIRSPFFISCMTGGPVESYEINKRLAEAAEAFGIPVGLGSIRVLLDDHSLLPDFQLKKIAPSVPLLANLGAAQLRSIKEDELKSILKELKADALVFHLNPAQELCQKHGERKFRGIQEAIREYIHQSEIPVIVKETGMGLHPDELQMLLGMGVAYVDLAGAGGTNWARIELQSYADSEIQESETLQDLYFNSFDHWGHPTALLLLASYGMDKRIASGGIRSARDILVSLVLGAEVAGLALPMLRAAWKSSALLHRYLQILTGQFSQLMLLTGARNIKEIAEMPFWLEPRIQNILLSYCESLNINLSAKVKTRCLNA